MPTVILEGLGYCFAASAGTIVGLSWINPKWVYGTLTPNRIEAVKRALKECLVNYFFATILLFSAAIVEVIMLTMI